MQTEPFLFSGRIPRCYDSHVHWQATGARAARLDLRGLTAEEDIHKLSVTAAHRRGSWVIGFGWDHHRFAGQSYPSRRTLDERFGDTPVYLTRVDGHAAWVNTAALKIASLWSTADTEPEGGKIVRDGDGWPTGVLIDLAMPLIAKHIPSPTAAQIRDHLLTGQAVFHRAGFTHIRDLTGDDDQWGVELDLEAQGLLHLAVERFFSADNPADFEKRVDSAVRAKKSGSRLLRPLGIKVYFDGALGSEGAWISRPYNSGSGQGLRLLEESRLREMMRVCFENELHLAVHAIGDEAAHRIAVLAHELKEKHITGSLHIEHAELLRPETVEILRHLQVVCHFQPCHWLSDKTWLHDKIGELTQHAFRWHDLDLAGVPFDFGSDTPIEETSIQRNFAAIRDAALHGIRLPAAPLVARFITAHSHPDTSWCAETYTEFQDGLPIQTVFLGKKIEGDWQN